MNFPAYDERHCYYGSRALLMSPEKLSDWLLPLFPSDIQFDTIVGTGLSGTIAIVKLALVWNKHTAFIRKPSESNHSSRIVEGSIGERWLFVDDIISTAQTVRRCAEIVTHTAPTARCVGGILYGDTYVSPQFINPQQMQFYGALV